MCGIVGFVGRRPAAPVLIEGLKKLEYRGYDSAGIAVLNGGIVTTHKRVGRVAKLEGAALEGNCGIGHTRWATHGAPTEHNAHPHSYGKFTIVHNGIIENAKELRMQCEERGEKFSSETDSEVIAHLLEFYYNGNLIEALQRATAQCVGSYALAVLCTEEEGKIALARRFSPLLLRNGKEGGYASSDASAIAEEGMELYALADGEFALLTEEGHTIYGADGAQIEKEPIEFVYDTDLSDRGGYAHFMKKEMEEIPLAIEHSRLKPQDIRHFSRLCEVLCHAECLQIVACGTAYHSGLAAKWAVEALARVKAEVYVASEYRYMDPIVPKGTVCIAISQSGETADTLAAAALAKERGATLVALTNVGYSSLTRLADFVLTTRAGMEVAVAATKSFNAQLVALYDLCTLLAGCKGRGCNPASLDELPRLARLTLSESERVAGWTAHFLAAKAAFFIGRGADYVTAREGSLKLKEISYLPGEGYEAGELKHGTLALIEEGTPVVAIATDPALASKTMNAVHEVASRGAKVFLITCIPALTREKEVFASILIPETEHLFSPALSVIPLQALAYYVSVARGNDPDKPRNLAKAVTVE